MPVQVAVAGRRRRSDHLTLEQVLAIEEAARKPWPEVNPFASARDAYALAAVLFPDAEPAIRAQPADVSSWMAMVDDDLPEAFRDCIPTMGGMSFDAYIVAFADPEGFGWPPDVTRRQKVRDLDLLLEAFKNRKRRR